MNIRYYLRLLLSLSVVLSILFSFSLCDTVTASESLGNGVTYDVYVMPLTGTSWVAITGDNYPCTRTDDYRMRIQFRFQEPLVAGRYYDIKFNLNHNRGDVSYSSLYGTDKNYKQVPHSLDTVAMTHIAALTETIVISGYCPTSDTNVANLNFIYTNNMSDDTSYLPQLYSTVTQFSVTDTSKYYQDKEMLDKLDQIHKDNLDQTGAIEEQTETIGGFFGDLVESVSGFFGNLGSTITSGLTTVWTNITSSISTMSSAITSGLTTVWNKITGAISTMSTAITNALTDLGNFIIDGLKSLFIPSDDFFDEYADNWQELMQDRFAPLYGAVGIINDVIGAFNTTISDGILFPEVIIPLLGGESFTFGGFYVSLLDARMIVLLDAIRLIIDIVCTLSFLNVLSGKLDLLFDNEEEVEG